MKAAKTSGKTAGKAHGAGIGPVIMKDILTAQRNEITEHHIYERLSRSAGNAQNRKVLKKISGDELRHSLFWKSYSKTDMKPDAFKMWKYYLISKILGITFGLKLMERGEGNAQKAYDKMSKAIPEVKKIEKDENGHENELLRMIDEERLKYVGSIVLGLNDALVELTGALAGFTFALQNSGLVSMAGLITGIAASLSMGASEYLSTKSEGLVEGGGKKPGRAAIYTTATYILTVMMLVAPFLLLTNIFVSLAAMLVIVVAVIFVFTFYISVAKELDFRRRFAEMVAISMGVAGASFVIGLLVRMFLNIQI